MAGEGYAKFYAALQKQKDISKERTWPKMPTEEVDLDD